MKPDAYMAVLVQGSRNVLRVGWFWSHPEVADEIEALVCTVYRTSYQKLTPIALSGQIPAGWSIGPRVSTIVHRIHWAPFARIDQRKWPQIGSPP